MSKFIIQGGRELNGEWRVQGMKNAATPILAATLLTAEECVIHNIPRISDLDHMLAILRDLGAKVSWLDEHTLRIRTKEIKKTEMDYLLTKRMRSSVLFMGPMLARAGELRMPEPGGCNIGNRPLTSHLAGLAALGAEIIVEKNGYYHLRASHLSGREVTLHEKSVTATENLMTAAVLVQGKTIIKNAAEEPHVASLGRFLRALGADISGEGTDVITIKGAVHLHGAEFTVIPDQLEAGTMAVLGALTGGEIAISPIVPADMRIVADKLTEAGVKLEAEGTQWRVSGSRSRLKPFNITTAPYPGFPTDLQAPFGLLATQSGGESVICDRMYDSRLGYLNELVKMGARAESSDTHTARVFGPTALTGQSIHSLDLRAGATLVMAALAASGETVLNDAEIIDRGYERIDERLRALGADIRRVD